MCPLLCRPACGNKARLVQGKYELQCSFMNTLTVVTLCARFRVVFGNWRRGKDFQNNTWQGIGGVCLLQANFSQSSRGASWFTKPVEEKKNFQICLCWKIHFSYKWCQKQHWEPIWELPLLFLLLSLSSHQHHLHSCLQLKGCWLVSDTVVWPQVNDLKTEMVSWVASCPCVILWIQLPVRVLSENQWLLVCTHFSHEVAKWYRCSFNRFSPCKKI